MCMVLSMVILVLMQRALVCLVVCSPLVEIRFGHSLIKFITSLYENFAGACSLSLNRDPYIRGSAKGRSDIKPI